MTLLDYSATFDADRVAALSKPGPRYTSYPTVPAWSEDIGATQWTEHLQHVDADAANEAPLSIYVHLPFCQARCHYCGCNVVITARRDKADRYIDYLAREMDLVCASLSQRRRVDQLHLGGGTPTFLDEAQLRRLWGELDSRFEIDRSGELALEVDPRVTSKAQLDLLRELGFNRVSFGVQTLDPAIQEAIGRVQPLEQTAELWNHARALGYRGMNVDLIYGLPWQTLQTIERSVSGVLELEPERVALFGYAHVPWLHPHQNKLDANALPDPRQRIELFGAARTALVEAGYVPIGMDHFALPTDELAVALRERRLRRSFQGYTTRAAGTTIAFGASAISDIAGGYAQNVKGIADYFRRLDAGTLPIERGYFLDDDDRLRRDVITELMCNFTVDLVDVTRRHGIDDMQRVFSSELERLQELEELGLVERDGARVTATQLGRLVIRNVAMIFDAHLARGRGGFSQTV